MQQQTELYFNGILDSLGSGILFIDASGMITTYNTSAEHFLEVDRKKVLLNNYWDNFDDHLFGFSMRSVLSSNKPEKITFMTHFSKKYPHQLFEVIAEKVTLPQGLTILLREISEVKQLEAVAMRNDKIKELNEMAAMVAHEIRNPLGGIRGFASLLQRDLKEDPQLHKLATYIVEGTDDLNRLVNDILDYAHPLKLQLKLTDLVQLMKEIIMHLNADESIDPRIELHCHSKKEQLFALVDDVSLKSALMNLASNAIQSMPEGGELNFDTDVNGCEVIIKVSDTGIGIPKENMAKLFSPLFTTKPKGHGLGLSEVYRIVQAHEGVLEVSSEQNVGTIFTIKLPLRIKE